MNEHLFVAESEDGEIAGYALSAVEPDKPIVEATLTAIHVRPSDRHSGIGSRLLDAVLESFQTIDTNPSTFLP